MHTPASSGQAPAGQRPPGNDPALQPDDAGQSQANAQEDAQAANNGKGAPTGNPNDLGQAGDYSR